MFIAPGIHITSVELFHSRRSCYFRVILDYAGAIFDAPLYKVTCHPRKPAIFFLLIPLD